MVRVLIVEDDIMLADFLEEVFISAGYDVCGVALNTAQALVLVKLNQPDLAVLDIHLANGDLGTKIVPVLNERKRVGILYATGSDEILLTKANGDVCIRKPYRTRDLLEAMRIVEQIVAGGAISSVVPTNARILS